MKRLKVINSHSGLARWLAETSGDAIGYLPRKSAADIASPYRYSPIIAVQDWNGRRVAWFETRHKRYEIFEIPANTVLMTESEATELQVA
jgi:hypothetical protein